MHVELRSISTNLFKSTNTVPLKTSFEGSSFCLSIDINFTILALIIQISIQHYVSKQWRPWLDAAFCGV